MVGDLGATVLLPPERLALGQVIPAAEPWWSSGGALILHLSGKEVFVA